MELQSILIAYITLHLALIVIGQVSPNSRFTFICGFLLFFFFTIYYIREFNENNTNWEILIVLIVIRLFLLGGYDLYEALTKLGNLPDLIFNLLGIISGFSYLRLENPWKLLPFMFSLVFASLFIFLDAWRYLAHYSNFGTFTGKINAYDLSQRVEGITNQNHKITNELIKNKIVLLDFWITTCGLCFKKFPKVQSVYDKYKDDPYVAIYTISKHVEGQTSDHIFEMIKSEGYSFPIVIPKDKELPEKFGVKGYPTTFVINKNSQIVYKGGIEGAVKMVDQLKLNSR